MGIKQDLKKVVLLNKKRKHSGEIGEYKTDRHVKNENLFAQAGEELTCIKETVLFKANYVSVFFFLLCDRRRTLLSSFTTMTPTFFSRRSFVKQQKTRCFSCTRFLLSSFFRELKRKTLLLSLLLLHRFPLAPPIRG